MAFTGVQYSHATKMRTMRSNQLRKMLARAPRSDGEPWVGRGGLESVFLKWLIFRSAPVNPAVLAFDSLLSIVLVLRPQAGTRTRIIARSKARDVPSR